MFFKKKKGKTPKTSNRKVVPNMKPIEELRTNKDVAEWCRDFLRITIGTPEQMQRFFAALDEILDE